MSLRHHLSPTEERLPAGAIDPESLESGSSLWQDAWARLKKNRLALISFWLLSFLLVIPVLWYLYRMIKGLLYLNDRRPMPV